MGIAHLNMNKFLAFVVLVLVLALSAPTFAAPTRMYTECRTYSVGGSVFNVYWDKLTGTSTSINIAFETDATSWAALGIGGSPTMVDIDAQVAMVLSGATLGFCWIPRRP